MKKIVDGKRLCHMAEEAYGWMERAERECGGSYVRRKSNAPEWVQDLCRQAHGDRFPDDWIYEQIYDCLACIADNECEHDALMAAENGVDVFYSDLCDWAKTWRGYVDDYIADAIADGATNLSDIIQCAQVEVIDQIFAVIVSFLTDMAEKREEEDELAEEEE